MHVYVLLIVRLSPLPGGMFLKNIFDIHQGLSSASSGHGIRMWCKTYKGRALFVQNVGAGWFLCFLVVQYNWLYNVFIMHTRYYYYHTWIVPVAKFAHSYYSTAAAECSTARHSSNTGMSYCCNRRAPAGSGEERWPHIPSRLYLGRNRVTFQNQYLVPTWYVLRPFRLLYAYSSREKHRAAYTRSTGHSTSRTS